MSCCSHIHNHCAVNTQETELFSSGKWSFYIDMEKKRRNQSIYIYIRSSFFINEYDHLFPSSITDGWIIIKEEKN
jgi:hypothetical protein